MTIYTVVVEDRENLIVHTDTFRTIEEAWQDIMTNAKETYGIESFDDYEDNHLLSENECLYLYDENAYYEIHINSL